VNEIDQGDALARAYSRLVSLRDSLSANSDTMLGEAYLTEFHGALDRLWEAGFDVAEFRVPDASLHHSSTSSSYMTGARGPVAVYVPRTLLLAKCGAVVGYFEMSSSEPKRPIGFRV
jgi:hypothetical protein